MRIKLRVYCDHETDPFEFPTLPFPESVSALRSVVEDRTKHAAKLISFWNFSAKRYDVLEHVDQLKQAEAMFTIKNQMAPASRTTSPHRERDVSSGMHALSASFTDTARTSATLSSSQPGDAGAMPHADPTAASGEETCVRVQLWIESTLLVLEPVEPDRDRDEFRELSAHVAQHMGNTFVDFRLEQASRVQFGYLERQFDSLRRDRLQARSPSRPSSAGRAARAHGDAAEADADDASDAVRMLYYTNNAWPVSSVLQFGFLVRDALPKGNTVRALPDSSPEPSSPSPPRALSHSHDADGRTPRLREDTQRNPFVFSSSMVSPDERTSPGGDGVVQKVLLCEVAPGRAWLSESPLTGPGSAGAPAQPPSGYDSILYYHQTTEHGTRTQDGLKKGPTSPAPSHGARHIVTQLRISTSHQALPRYVLYVTPTTRAADTRTASSHERTSAASAIASFFKAPIQALRSSPPRHSATRGADAQAEADADRSVPPRSSSLRRRCVSPPPQPRTSPRSSPTARDAHRTPQQGRSRTAPSSPSQPSTSTSFHAVHASPSAPPPPPQSASPPRDAIAYYAPGLARSPRTHTRPVPLSSALSPAPSSRPSTPALLDPLTHQKAQDLTYTSHRRTDSVDAPGRGSGGSVMVRDASSYGAAAQPRPGSAARRAVGIANAGPGLLYRSSLTAPASTYDKHQPQSPPRPSSATRQPRGNHLGASPAHTQSRSSPSSRGRPTSRTAGDSAGRTAATVLDPRVATSAAFRCPVHHTYLTSLFCRTCRELTCPYCASVGPHRGHEVVEASEEAGHVSRQVHDLCAELSEWLNHFSRIQSQLAVEQSDAVRRRAEQTQSLRSQMQEIRRALDHREQHLVRQLSAATALSSSAGGDSEDPVQLAARVCAKYRRALVPLEDALRQYRGSGRVASTATRMAASTEGTMTTPSSTAALAQTLHFLRVAPELEREALAYFARHDKHEEARLQMQVDYVRDAHKQAESILQSLQIGPVKQCIAQIGVPASASARLSSTNSSRAVSPGQSPRTPRRTQSLSPSRNRFDAWSTSSLTPRTAVAVESSANHDGGRSRRVSTAASLEYDDTETTTTMTSMASNANNRAGASANARKDHVLTHRCLLDLQRGYIWVIEDAARYFEPTQSQSVCSTPFRLLNAKWEIRIGPLPKRGSAAAAAMGGTAPGAGRRITFVPGTTTGPLSSHGSGGAVASLATSMRVAPLSVPSSPSLIYEAESGDEEWLGLFLFPIDHALRMDFRVIAFSEVCWMEWKAQGWGADYAGKGWGLYPFLKRKDLMRTDKLACHNMVKLCVAPISDLY